MVAELGHFALVLALAVAVWQTVVPLWGATRGNSAAMESARPAALAQFGLIGIAFAALVQAFVTSDFSLKLVYENSNTLQPMIYKITGVWGNHEGSMLLWVLILSLFGAAAAVFDDTLPPGLRARVLSVQGLIGVAFLAFILFTSNPFLRLDNPPFDGRDLNPLLQDPGLAFHPPFLYLGYVGLSMSFSFAVAALLEGRVDAAWARWVRPWTLAAWMFLTIGIWLGSSWAYYELGWGGVWFWDPVENASFIPWLFGAALLHSAVVVEKRESLKSWTILLAILAFGFSLIGTFIVRSGVITSVHSFASDPTRGVFILAILVGLVGGALTLFAFRASEMTARGVFSPISREGALVLNNVLLAVAGFVVFIGTIWPVVAETWGRTLSVGAPFFDKAFTPFMIVLAIVLPIGAILPWKRGKIRRVTTALRPAFILTLAVMGLVYTVSTGHTMMAVIGAGLGSWLIFGAVVDLRQRMAADPRRLPRLPRADYGRVLAHSGLGFCFIGLSLMTAWQVEDIRVAQIGEPFNVSGYDVTLQAVDEVPGPNYISTQATMQIDRDGRKIATLHPEKRFYPVQRMPTTEAAIQNGLFRDLYLVIGDAQQNGGWTVRTFIKPFTVWIWFGSFLMAFGGLISLSDRRRRVAAGARREGKRPAPAHGVAAE